MGTTFSRLALWARGSAAPLDSDFLTWKMCPKCACNMPLYRIQTVRVGSPDKGGLRVRPFHDLVYHMTLRELCRLYYILYSLRVEVQ